MYVVSVDWVISLMGMAFWLGALFATWFARWLAGRLRGGGR